MKAKSFTLTYNSQATGKTERKTISAKSFYVERDCLMFIDENDQTVAAYQWARVDSLESDAVKDAAQ